MNSGSDSVARKLLCASGRSRTLSSRTPARERTDRLYEAALRYEPPQGRLGLELGRIGVHRFVGSGFLDGGLVRFQLLPAVQLGAETLDLRTLEPAS